VLTDWQPACDLKLLKLRAHLLQQIRRFFAERCVLEVETPLLCHAAGTDPNLAFFSSRYESPPNQHRLFLQTSPEFAMKRLLAAGSGSIFQICKAFRNNEAGRYHNPEFTLLEWYRVDFDLLQLMDEAEALVRLLFADKNLGKTERFTYQEVFLSHTGLDPFAFHFNQYRAYAEANGLPEATALCGHDLSRWLDFLFSHRVQPSLGGNGLVMVYGYPACQAALARLRSNAPHTAERVELFMHGIELGNGYHELIDPVEQERRFDQDLAIRRQHGQAEIKKDPRFLAALASGLPACSGLAVGLDRILMLLSNSPSINDVLAFPIDRA